MIVLDVTGDDGRTATAAGAVGFQVGGAVQLGGSEADFHVLYSIRNPEGETPLNFWKTVAKYWLELKPQA